MNWMVEVEATIQKAVTSSSVCCDVVSMAACSSGYQPLCNMYQMLLLWQPQVERNSQSLFLFMSLSTLILQALITNFDTSSTYTKYQCASQTHIDESTSLLSLFCCFLHKIFLLDSYPTFTTVHISRAWNGKISQLHGSHYHHLKTNKTGRDWTVQQAPTSQTLTSALA